MDNPEGEMSVNRSELPLPDYDHLPVGSLTHRVRTLDETGVQMLLEYERRHGNRAPVLTVLESRRDQLQSGAPPSGGSPLAERPESAPPPQREGTASPQTAGPPVNPPSHGDPTNPAQPRGPA